jgi:cobalt/nickel transport system permease protein
MRPLPGNLARNRLILFALHLSDGLLPFEWCLAGWLAAGAVVLLGCWRLRDEEIPRLGLLTAAFFVSSAIHVPLGFTSVHLLLNGLVGALLGWRATIAIFLGLLLQMAFLGHGGWTTIGVNTLVIALPALIAGQLFRVLVRLGA